MRAGTLVMLLCAFAVSWCSGQAWVPLEQPEGGITADIAFGPDGSMYITTGQPEIDLPAQSGLWRSMDHGGTWQHCSASCVAHSVAVNSTTGEIFMGGSAAYRSSDEGATWTQLGTMSGHIDAIASEGTDKIYVASRSSGLFVSHDNGATWDNTFSGSLNFLQAFGGGLVMAGFTNSTYRSTDDGMTWAAVPGNLSGATDICRTANGDLHMATTSFGVFRSTDQGATWIPERDGLPAYSPFYRWVTAIACASNGDLYCGTKAYGAYRLPNGSTQWTNISAGLPRWDIGGMDIDAEGRLWATTDGGVWYSDDEGITWISSNGQLANSTVYALTSGTGERVIAGTSQSVLFSDDDGSTWTPSTAGLPRAISILSLATASNGTVYAGGGEVSNPAFYLEPRIYRSTDNGVTWDTISNGAPAGGGVIALAVNAAQHVFAASGNSLYRSTDQGMTWGNVETFPNEVLSLLPLQGDTLLAGTYQDGAFRSTNNGQSWTPANTLSSSSVYAFAQGSNGTIYAGVNGGLRVSFDRGSTWETVTGAGGTLVALWYDASSDLLVTLMSMSFVNVYSISGSSATLQADLSQHLSADGCGGGGKTILGQAGRVLIGTEAHGIFRTSEWVSVRENSIEQGHAIAAPNPFSGSVALNLPSSHLGPLTITDMIGGEIRTFSNLTSDRIVWDGRTDSGTEVPPGMYLVAVTTQDGQRYTQRVIKQ